MLGLPILPDRDSKKREEAAAFARVCESSLEYAPIIAQKVISDLALCLIKSRALSSNYTDPEKSLVDSLGGTMGQDIKNCILFAIDKAADNVKNKHILDKTTMASVDFEMCMSLQETITRLMEYTFTLMVACEAFGKNAKDGDNGKPVNKFMMTKHTQDIFKGFDKFREAVANIFDAHIADLTGAKKIMPQKSKEQKPTDKKNLKDSFNNLTNNLL